MNGAPPLLEVRNIRKQFPGVLALDNVSAQLQRAKFSPSSAKTAPANPR